MSDDPRADAIFERWGGLLESLAKLDEQPAPGEVAALVQETRRILRERDKASAHVAMLREALREYGMHKEHCRRSETNGFARCTCRLAELLAATEASCRGP